MNTVDSSSFDMSDDVNVKWTFLRERIREIIIVMCPLKKIYVRKRQPPWLDNSIYRLFRERERLSRMFRNTGDSDVLREFKIVRNKTTQAVRNARRDFINVALNRNKNDPRKFWRIINSLYNSTEVSIYDGGFTDPFNGLCVPIDNISDFLNDYFANIGSRLYTLNDVILDDVDELYPEMFDSNFAFAAVDRFDIQLLAKDIDIRKASCIPKFVVTFVNMFLKTTLIK